MNENYTEERLDTIAKRSKKIYYSSRLFEENNKEGGNAKIFLRELKKGKGNHEKLIWAIIVKYKIFGSVPQEVIMGILEDTLEQKENAIEIINLMNKQLKQNAISETGYENYESLERYVKSKKIPFKLTIEGREILLYKGKENTEIIRTCFENKLGKIEELFPKEYLEKMNNEKISELNKYVKERKILEKWKERREKIIKSLKTEEKIQKFLNGERITEFLKKSDSSKDIQKNIAVNYLLEEDSIGDSKKQNLKAKLLDSYLKIKEKGISIDVKRVLEDIESEYYRIIKEKKGEISSDDYNKLEIVQDYKTFFDLVKMGKDWNARVFALKLKKIEFKNLKKLIKFAKGNDKELLDYLDLKEKIINEVQTNNIDVNCSDCKSLKELNGFLVKSSIREKTKEDDEHVILGIYEYIKKEIIINNINDIEFYNDYAKKSYLDIYQIPKNKKQMKELGISKTTMKICEYINNKYKNIDNREIID